MAKKEKDNKSYNPDKNVHRTFQVGAIAVVGYILYSFFSGGGIKVERPLEDGEQCLSEEEVAEKIRTGLKKLVNSDELKGVKDFVNAMNSNVSENKPTTYSYKGGVIIYVPDGNLADKNIVVEGKDSKFIVTKQNN